MSTWSLSTASVGAVCVAAVLALAGCRGSDAGNSSTEPGRSPSAGVSTSPVARAGAGEPKAGAEAKPTAPSGRRGAPSPSDDFTKAAVKPEESKLPNPFDSLYDRDFSLADLSADPAGAMEKPAVADGLKKSAALDPANKTFVYRATDASKAEGGFVRHDNSHKQAFNADNTRFIARDGQGAWYLYDAATFKQIERLGELKGNCEPIWHASDPNLLHFTLRDGGTTWWTYNVEAEKGEVMFDFSGKTPWSQATSFSTKGRGAASADGRYLALIATRHDEATQTRNVYGVVVLDVKDKRIVGTLDARNFPKPGAFPDYVSASPSGRHVVVSWPGDAGGTRAYTRDLKDSFELPTASKHAGLAYGPQKQDYYVFADYGKNQLSAVDLDSHERIDLRSLHPAKGENYTLDISGQAYDKPGWAVVSTYGEKKDDASDESAPQERAEYRKVWLVELKAGGRALSVANVRTNASAIGGSSKGAAPQAAGDPDFFKPQASASRDLSRIVFADNFGRGPIESYMVGLPSWAVR
mgnify:FL=1